jgi:peptidoglycan hydrolase-like protein with peptidoglycan-binding domain
MGEFFDQFGDEIEAAVTAKPTFGADWDGDSMTVMKVQAAINALGYTPALKVDGMYGPNTRAGIVWYQASKGLNQTGVADEQTLGFLGIPIPPPVPVVKISTVAAALRQAAAEKGHTLSPGLLSLMIGQLRGAEGAYPGVKSTLGGTNNMGAAQVTKGLVAAKAGVPGWGAFAHKDTDPNRGAYIGWYWIAPNPLEAARHWFQDNWWGPALAQANPQNAHDYAAILYKGGYFQGNHPGDTARDPNSEAGAQNVAEYAAGVQRGVASAAELAEPPDDPSINTVNPAQFAPLSARQITESMFDTAKSGGVGSAWSYLLSGDWLSLLDNNGVVWFGAPPDLPGAIRGVRGAIARVGAAVKAHPYRTVGAATGLFAFVGLIMTAAKTGGPAQKVLVSTKSPPKGLRA